MVIFEYFLLILNNAGNLFFNSVALLPKVYEKVKRDFKIMKSGRKLLNIDQRKVMVLIWAFYLT